MNINPGPVPLFSRLVVKIVLFLLILALISFFLIRFFFLSYTEDIFKNHAGENAVAVVQSAFDTIQKNVQFRIEFVESYSSDTLLHQAIIESNDAFMQIGSVDQFIQHYDQHWNDASTTVTDFKQSLLENTLANELGEFSEFFYEKYEYRVYPEIFVTNKFGANIAQTGQTSDYYQADEIWWQNAVAFGTYVGPVKYDESTEVHSVTIAVSIVDEAGESVGVIKAELNVQEIAGAIEQLTPSYNAHNDEKHLAHGHTDHSTMFFTLFDQGNPVYSNKPKSKTSKVTYDHEDIHRARSAMVDYHYPVADDGTELLLAHVSGFLHHTQEFLPDATRLELVLEHDVEEVLRDSTTAVDRFIVLSLAIFSFFFLSVILFLLIFVISPVTALTRITTAAATSDGVYKKIKIKASGEIARLIDVFNYAMDSLNASKKSLENQVQMRTRELRKTQQNLEDQLADLEKFQALTVDRELKMIALKDEITALKAKLEKNKL